MEVLETKDEAEKKAEQKKHEEEVVKEISKTLHEAQERVDARHSDEESSADEDKPMEADVDSYVSGNRPLEMVKERVDAVSLDRVDENKGKRVVSVTEAEKRAFFDSVISGSRYKATVTLFNGGLSISFRSRSAIESEAVDAFIRKRVALGKIQSNQEYADTMRFAVLAAGVEELNGQKFPTLTEAGETNIGMFYAETKTGLDEPKWLWLYDKWRAMAESVVAVAVEAYFAFEAKYWLMIRNADNENFWKTGESTGE